MTTDCKHFIVRGKFASLPSFSSVVKLIEDSKKNGDFFVDIGSGGYMLTEGHKLESVQTITGEIESEYGLSDLDAHIYVSMSESSDTFGRHCDDMDVYYIQGDGTLLFIIEECGHKYEYEMVSGDMVYIPTGIYHTPIPKSKRFGISIG